MAESRTIEKVSFRAMSAPTAASRPEQTTLRKGGARHSRNMPGIKMKTRPAGRRQQENSTELPGSGSYVYWIE